MNIRPEDAWLLVRLHDALKDKNHGIDLDSPDWFRNVCGCCDVDHNLPMSEIIPDMIRIIRLWT